MSTDPTREKSPYEIVIGLEVHVQLKTKTKIFCRCPTKFGENANSQVCPVCMGYPGALPVLNQQAVEYAIKLAIATHCQIASRSIFARKNYFYPDLPKGYQISQYEKPLCENGYVQIVHEGQKRKIGITRIHMEEDAGKLIHADAHHSLVNYNRACVPLLEVVSEPQLRSPEEAGNYLREIRQIVRYLDISDGNMEEGSLRCDANISLRPWGQEKLGTKVELKNLNSFRFVEKALEYEVHRQSELLEEGREAELVQETRLFDSAQGLTLAMRGKEHAHDYRYFPDPDLLPLEIDQAWIARVRKNFPELPREKRERFVKDFKLPAYDAEVLTQDRQIADFFERTVKDLNPPKNAKKASNWVMGDLTHVLKDHKLEVSESPLTPKHLAGLLNLIEKGKISGKIAKTVFAKMFETGQQAEVIVKKEGLEQVTDTQALEETIQTLIDQNPEQTNQYREGKTKVLSFFVGQVMKETKGKANPKMVNEILLQKLPKPKG
jgi:aspartyl-tRNA(Asn)/glutamyl-tRNA(Gln) amidotransferase subunit B